MKRPILFLANVGIFVGIGMLILGIYYDFQWAPKYVVPVHDKLVLRNDSKSDSFQVFEWAVTVEDPLYIIRTEQQRIFLCTERYFLRCGWVQPNEVYVYPPLIQFQFYFAQRSFLLTCVVVGIVIILLVWLGISFFIMKKK